MTRSFVAAFALVFGRDQTLQARAGMARDEGRRARESQVCHHRIVLCRHFYPPAGEGLVWEATAPSRLFPQFWERVGEAGAQQREARQA